MAMVFNENGELMGEARSVDPQTTLDEHDLVPRYRIPEPEFDENGDFLYSDPPMPTSLPIDFDPPITANYDIHRCGVIFHLWRDCPHLVKEIWSCCPEALADAQWRCRCRSVQRYVFAGRIRKVSEGVFSGLCVNCAKTKEEKSVTLRDYQKWMQDWDNEKKRREEAKSQAQIVQDMDKIECRR
jgi:hypothetical protein